MSAALPYALENLAGAAVRPLLCPVDDPSDDLPEKLSDIFDQKAPYAANGDWFNVGATAGPAQVARNLAVQGYTIEQAQVALLEEPTEVTYTVQIPFAELRPEIIALASEGVISEVGPATATDGAGSMIKVGSISDLQTFRVALVTRRKKAQGIVLEGAGGLARGRWLVFVGYSCTISAENIQTSLGKGQLAQMPVTFKLSPIESLDEGEEYGFWFDEDAQTIPAA